MPRGVCWESSSAPRRSVEADGINYGKKYPLLQCWQSDISGSSDMVNDLSDLSEPRDVVRFAIKELKDGVVIGDGYRIILMDQWMNLSLRVGQHVRIFRCTCPECENTGTDDHNKSGSDEASFPSISENDIEMRPIDTENISNLDSGESSPSLNGIILRSKGINRTIEMAVGESEHLLISVEDDVETVSSFLDSYKCENFTIGIPQQSFNFSSPCAIVGTVVHKVIELVNVTLKDKKRRANVHKYDGKVWFDNLPDPDVTCVEVVDQSSRNADNNEKRAAEGSWDGQPFMKPIAIEGLKGIVKSILVMVILSEIPQLYSCRISFSELYKTCLNHLKVIPLGTPESSVVSFNMNLKGKIDLICGDGLIEIKTGKRNVFDRAQAIIYSLMSRRKPFLLYTSEGVLEKVAVKHSEVVSLLVQRSNMTLRKVFDEGIDNLGGECGEGFFLRDCNCLRCQNNGKLDSTLMHYFRRSYFNHKLRPNFIEAFYVNKRNGVLSLAHNIGDQIEYVLCRYNDSIYISIFSKQKLLIGKGRLLKYTQDRLYIITNDEIENHVSLLISFESFEVYKSAIVFSVVKCASVYHKIISDDEIRNEFRRYIAERVEASALTTGEVGEVSVEKRLSLDSSYGFCEKGLVDTKRRRLSKLGVTGVPICFASEFNALNENQRRSIFLSLNGNNIIHGMPGTGKTRVIALLIKILNYYGKKVLIVGHTNMSLVNIIKKINFPVYYTNASRYGTNSAGMSGAMETKCHERLLNNDEIINAVDNISKYYDSFNVVATTLFRFSDPIFINRKFDYLIIEESSQIDFLLCFTPMSICKNVVIIGDPNQLGPIDSPVSVFDAFDIIYKISSEKRNGLLGTGENGVDFEILKRSTSEENAPYVFTKSELTVQYRMGHSIMKVPNIMFYGGKMICGCDKKSKVEFVDVNSLDSTICYIKKMYENNGKPCCQKDLRIQKAKGNYDLVTLTYFNSTCNFIKKRTDITCFTIDKFQGSESNSIILVIHPIADNEIIQSRERLNVALTRAKERLVILGDRSKMVRNSLFSEMLLYI